MAKIYGPSVMGDLREYEELERDDTSKDEEIMARTADENWQAVFLWNGLLGGHSSRVKRWVKDIYGVDLDTLPPRGWDKIET